jgi:hypothetical protein
MVTLLVILNVVYSVLSLVVFFFFHLIIQSLLAGGKPEAEYVFQAMILRVFLMAFTLPSLVNWYLIYQQKYQTAWYLFLIPCGVIAFVAAWFFIASSYTKTK